MLECLAADVDRYRAAITVPDELPEVFDRLASDLERYRAAITVPTIASVADRYLAVLGLART